METPQKNLVITLAIVGLLVITGLIIAVVILASRDASNTIDNTEKSNTTQTTSDQSDNTSYRGNEDLQPPDNSNSQPTVSSTQSSDNSQPDQETGTSNNQSNKDLSPVVTPASDNNNPQVTTNPSPENSNNPQPSSSTQSSSRLPPNWQQLTTDQKIALNPYGCIDTTKIRADNGQCLSDGSAQDSDYEYDYDDSITFQSALFASLNCSALEVPINPPDSHELLVFESECIIKDNTYYLSRDFSGISIGHLAESNNIHASYQPSHRGRIITNLLYGSTKSKNEVTEECLRSTASSHLVYIIYTPGESSSKIWRLLFTTITNSNYHDVSIDSVLADAARGSLDYSEPPHFHWRDVSGLCNYLIADRVEDLLGCTYGTGYHNLEYVSDYLDYRIEYVCQPLIGESPRSEYLMGTFGPIWGSIEYVVPTLTGEFFKEDLEDYYPDHYPLLSRVFSECATTGSFNGLVVSGGYSGSSLIVSTKLFSTSRRIVDVKKTVLPIDAANHDYTYLTYSLNRGGINTLLIDFCDYV